MSLQLISQVVMVAVVAPSPLPETDLTLSQFRAETGRSLEDLPVGVVISASYSKVRRQGRKGDSDPFSLNIINTGDTTGNTGDRELKDAEERQSEEAIAAVTSQMEDYQSETTTAAVKGPRRILIFLKSEQPIMFDQSVLKFDLEKEVGGDVTVFVNQDQDVINEIVQVQGNQKSIILNLSLAQNNKDITGNIFSEGISLENLEGDQFEEALTILNTTRFLLDKILVSSKLENEKSNQSEKKIIVLINSVMPISGEVRNLMKTKLEERFQPTESVVLVNEPQQLVNEEYRSVRVPILVSITLDNHTSKLAGNLYYGSQSLESIQDEAKRNEALEILGIVTSVLESYLQSHRTTTINYELKPEVNFYEYEFSADSVNNNLQAETQTEQPTDPADNVDEYFLADDPNLPESESYLYYDEEDYEENIVGGTESPSNYEDVDFGLIQEITRI